MDENEIPQGFPNDLLHKAVEKYCRRFMLVYPDRKWTQDDLMCGADRPSGKRTGRWYGICTACGNCIGDMDAPPNEEDKKWKFRNNVKNDIGKTECPCCGRVVEARKGWLSRAGIAEKFYLRMWEAVSTRRVVLHEGLIHLANYEDYRGNGGAPEWFGVSRYRVHVLTPGSVRTYRTEYVFDYEAHTWYEKLVPIKSINVGNESEYAVHEFNEEVLSGTFLRNIHGAVAIYRDERPQYVLRFIEEPMTELFYKAGFVGVANERLYKRGTARGTRHIDLGAKSPKKMFRGCKANGAGEKMKRLLKLFKRPANVTLEYLEKAAEIFIRDKNAKPETFAAISDAAKATDAMKMLELCGMLPEFPAERVAKYAAANDINIYRDYIKAARENGAALYEARNAFPEDLRAWHDEQIRRKIFRTDPKLGEKVEARHAELVAEGYEYEWRGIYTVIPETPSDIIAEGECQQHCVGRLYLSPHADGESNIIFIRRRGSSASWFTLEVDPKTRAFKQCYGYKNKTTGLGCTARANYDPLCGEFLKHYAKRLEWAKKNKKKLKKLQKTEDNKCRKTA